MIKVEQEKVIDNLSKPDPAEIQPKQEMVEPSDVTADNKRSKSLNVVEKQRQVLSRSPSPIKRHILIQQPVVALERLADKVVEAAMPPEIIQSNLPEKDEQQITTLRRSSRISLPPRRFGEQLVDSVKEICKDVAAGFKK